LDAVLLVGANLAFCGAEVTTTVVNPAFCFNDVVEGAFLTTVALEVLVPGGTLGNLDVELAFKWPVVGGRGAANLESILETFV
jgi:hypothetical protein